MITVNQYGKMSVELTNGEHSIISDVSKETGGEDEGLNPHELVEAALGACTTLTLELYARRKNWDLTNMVVNIKIVKETKESSVIERSITFGEQTTPEQRARLLEIANKCPIHNLLESNIKVETYEK
ncbi:OsmC family protein [Peredibacter starrii]|uniref:OsmC family protein n=1 Tax=Peredibacter starrii TaxID=28202 RepID=A0AAX4HU10_9BACT|nr:OsmC family protein [Peredibacter starrii]WPU66466.1 OsmC family protein [Peredibacter starrii]